MGLITEEVEVNLFGGFEKYYENKGYHIPRRKSNRGIFSFIAGTKIRIKVEDLPEKSGINVDCQCDGNSCGKLLENMEYRNYIKNKKEDGKIYCQSCAMKLYGSENNKKSRLKNSIKFKFWCIENNRYDYLELCDKERNEFGPEDIGFSTAKIKPYFLCHRGIHESEQRCLNILTSKRNTKITCSQCNSLGFNFPQTLFLWSENNEKSSFFYSYRSNDEVWWRCENNIHKDYKRNIRNSVKFKFCCSECTRERDESFLQEKVRLYLEELCDRHNWKLNHEDYCEISCQNPNTKGNRGRMIYDNEIIANDFSLIIEVHGAQHYKLSKWNYLSARKNNTTPEDELKYVQWKDEIKMNCALNNGYYYLAIPYTADDKLKTYKTMIDDMLNYIHENI